MKITDTMRLDWLTKSPRLYGFNSTDWSCLQGHLNQEYVNTKWSGVARGNTPRQAIDAAIRADRKKWKVKK